jgi:hypothetical protein
VQNSVFAISARKIAPHIESEVQMARSKMPPQRTTLLSASDREIEIQLTAQNHQIPLQIPR